MLSGAGRTLLLVIGALAIVFGSFWTTLMVLDYWGTPEPAYDAASLPRLAPGQTLSFANGQNRSVLLAGWSVPEGQGSWSLGNTAYLGFVVGDRPGEVKQAILHALVFLVADKLKEQKVEVWSGGKQLTKFVLKDAVVELRIPLADVPMSNDRPVILKFYLPDAHSPQDLQSGQDKRVIAIQITSLQLAP